MTKPFVLVPRNIKDASIMLVHEEMKSPITFYPQGFQGLWMEEVFRAHENMDHNPRNSNFWEIVPIEPMTPRRGE